MHPTIEGAMSRQNGQRPTTASNKGWERMEDELPEQKMGTIARQRKHDHVMSVMRTKCRNESIGEMPRYTVLVGHAV